MTVYICETIDDFHQCQMILIRKGYKWWDFQLQNGGYLDLNLVSEYWKKQGGAELVGTYQLYVEYNKITGWDMENTITGNVDEIINFVDREKKLKRILNDR